MLDHLDDRTTAIAAAIGALIVAISFAASALGDGGRRWAAVAAVVIAVGVGRALPTVRRSLPLPGLAPLPLAAALLAVAACVPETGPVYLGIVLVGAVVALELGTRRQADIVWYALAAGLIGWIGLWGASARPSALVGALFAWWAVLLLPLVEALEPVRARVPAIAVAAVGAIAVVIMARTGGVADSGGVALLAAVVTGGVSLAVAYAIARSSSRPG
jgi:hypothetical protein